MTELWERVLTEGVGATGSPLPKEVWASLYGRLAAFSDFVAARPAYFDLFNRTAKQWQHESGLRLHYGGYFSPYFRNRVRTSTGLEIAGGYSGSKTLKNVNKIVIQFCEPYYRYLAREHPELLRLGPFRELIEGLSSALFSSWAYYREMIAALAAVQPALAHNLLDHALPPVSIRLIRYVPDRRYFADPHVDKSALTIIMDTDEAAAEPCLVFAPADASCPRLSAFQPAKRQPEQSLIFFGAAPAEGGFAVRPATHAVRPQSSSAPRHVALFFWMLPGVDMAAFKTTTPFVDDVNLSRQDLSAGDDLKLPQIA